jgi:hypothetical protein
MTKTLAMIVNASGATVVIGTAIHTIANDHPNFEAIQEAYAEGDAEQLETLISVTKTLESYGQGVIRITGGKLFYGDREVSTGLARRIIKLMNEGRENFAKPLIAFMENVLLNPSKRAVDELYEWLEKSNLPITECGSFIAWKIVRKDFKDVYTGKFDNSPGKVVEVARNEVDENSDRTCSYGLHICSNEYLPHYGNVSGGSSTIVMVKVNPRDVVAFPKDYNTAKGRVSRYEVLQEVTLAETDTKFANNKSGVYREPVKASKAAALPKRVTKLETRGDRAEITLVFSDGTKQVTKNRLGNTLGFDQVGDTVTLRPSGRTIKITA